MGKVTRVIDSLFYQSTRMFYSTGSLLMSTQENQQDQMLHKTLCLHFRSHFLLLSINVSLKIKYKKGFNSSNVKKKCVWTNF